MNNIDLNTLLQAKIYYYFHTIGYIPKDSALFQKLKKNLLIDKLPENISDEDIKKAQTNILIYKYICMNEELFKATKEIKNCTKKALEFLADAGDIDACYAVSQFYHNITLNVCYNIDETKTYVALKNTLLNGKNPNNKEYLENIKKSRLLIYHGGKNANQASMNTNLLWIYKNDISKTANKCKDETLMEKARELAYASAQIDNIKKGILFTGNPDAEYSYFRKHKKENDTTLLLRLVVSASRVNFLMENPDFNIGSADAQWRLFNSMKKGIDLSEFGIDYNDTKLQQILLESSARIDEVKYNDIVNNYSGNTNALIYYYDKINRNKCDKKYKKIKKSISDFFVKNHIKLK